MILELECLQVPDQADAWLPLLQPRRRWRGGRISLSHYRKEATMRIFGIPLFVAAPALLVTVLVVCGIIALVKYIVKK